MKEKIAFWYKYGIWTEEMVRCAVSKKVLTEEEAAEVLAQSPVTMAYR